MKPENIIQLKNEEEVLAVVHEHILPKLPKMVFFFLWFVLPFFFLFALMRMGTIGIVIFAVLAISGLFFLLKTFWKWGNTMLVITDRRIVDVNQNALFDREITELGYHQIDEVSYRVKGAFSTIFGLGILRLKTSGQGADVEFSRIRKPARIHDLINDLRKVIDDPEDDLRERKIRKLSEDVTDEELDEVREEVRQRKRQKDLTSIFVDDEENPFKVKR